MIRLFLAGALALVALASPAHARAAPGLHAECNVTMPCIIAPVLVRREHVTWPKRQARPHKPHRAKARPVERRPAARPVKPALAQAVPVRVPSFSELVDVALATLTPLQDLPAAPAEVVAKMARAIEVSAARVYLVATATPGGTMGRQGPSLAISRLHPQFAVRLAGAIKEARASGLPAAGVFSAYRPPAFGVGGFRDKAASLHAYGLAVDMTGIGRPGSKQSIRWFAIAGRHSIFNPYGPAHRAEWNHYQPTYATMIARNMALRRTITLAGPIDPERMWSVAKAIIRDAPYVGAPPAAKRRIARRHHHRHYASR